MKNYSARRDGLTWECSLTVLTIRTMEPNNKAGNIAKPMETSPMMFSKRLTFCCSCVSNRFISSSSSSSNRSFLMSKRRWAWDASRLVCWSFSKKLNDWSCSIFSAAFSRSFWAAANCSRISDSTSACFFRSFGTELLDPLFNLD